jgi:predicted phosphoadenosine phosphosulfate sulfurtransferase
VIRLVDRYRQEPWVRMLWYALPLQSTMFVLGDVREYVQWDPFREHAREIPPWAITAVEGREGETFSQYDMDQVVASHFRGKIAAVTGIRASESLVRFRASVNKLNENYITASDTGLKGTPGAARKRAPNLLLAKPIYDWDENDVLQYIWEHQLDYAPAYDAQHLAGVGLRVSTPLHAEAAKHFGRLRETEPALYASCIAIWPEMQLQERYWRDLDRGALLRRYGQSFAGVRAYITEHITDEKSQRLAFRRLDDVETMALRRPESWPPEYILNAFVTGAFKRVIQPLKPKQEGSAA